MSPPERPAWLLLPVAFPLSPDRRWYWDGARWQPNLPPPPSVALARVVMVAVAVATASVTAPVAYLLYVFGAFESSTLAIGGGIAVFTVAEFAFLVAGLLGVICLPAWTHSCHSYLTALGARRLRWSPAWAAWGWFVPLLNLAIPPLVIREIWQHSRREQERWPPLIWAWWVTWLAGDVALVTTLIDRSWVAVSIPLWLSSQVVSCVLLVRLVGLISRRLEERYAGMFAALGVRPPGQPPGPTG